MLDHIIYAHEHKQAPLPEEVISHLLWNGLPKLIDSVAPKGKTCCAGYYIGLWPLPPSGKALYIAPKFDANEEPTHYLQMLSACLHHPEILGHTDELFLIDLDAAPIWIEQKDDLITPLLMVQFLRCVRRIAQKGLKKGYYKVEESRRSSVKGKILVTKNIRQNHLKNDYLHTWCSYDEFGLNSPENRLLKTVVEFVQRAMHLPAYRALNIDPVLRYILPAFEQVEGDFDPRLLGHLKKNPFFSEYHEGISLGKLLLKRLGYHISSIKPETIIKIQPFWIDMSKLFELFVLGKLKEALTNGDMIFQSRGKNGYLDFLHTAKGDEMIIDAKYKAVYCTNGHYDIEDIRQLSAYARDRGQLAQTSIPAEKWKDTVLNCLIIHPDKNADKRLHREQFLLRPIPAFEKFFHTGIALPVITAGETA